MSWQPSKPKKISMFDLRSSYHQANPSSVEASLVGRVVGPEAIARLTGRSFGRNLVSVVLLLLLIFGALSSFVVWRVVNYTYRIDGNRFSDSAMRSSLVAVDVNEDGYISLSEADAIYELEIDGARTIDGLEIFPNLTSLTATGSGLVSIDMSDLSMLTYLNLSNTGISEIDLTQASSLETLDLSGDPVSEIDLSALSALKSLDVSDTSLSSIDVSSNTELLSIECDQTLEITGLSSTKLTEYWLPVEFITSYTATESVSSYNSTIELEYDPTGAVTSLVSKSRGTSTTSEYSYDEEGKLSALTITQDDDSESWSFEYLENGQLSEALNETTNEVLTYSYDEAGNLIAVIEKDISTDEELANISMEYDEAGQISRVVSSDYVYVFTWDEEGKLISIDTEGAEFSCDYSYDLDGNCISIYFSASGLDTFTETFEYDSLGYLVGASGTVTTSIWSSLTSDYLDELEDVDSMQLEYDDYGNITQATVYYESSLSSSSSSSSSSASSDTYTVEYQRFLLAEDITSTQSCLMMGDPLLYCRGLNESWNLWNITETLEDPLGILQLGSWQVFDGVSIFSSLQP